MGNREQSIRMAAAKICHEDQLVVWQGEVIDEIIEHLKEPDDSEDVLALHADVRRAILHIAEGVLGALGRPV